MMSPRSKKIGKFVLYEIIGTAVLAGCGLFLRRSSAGIAVANSSHLLGEHGFIFGTVLPLLMYVGVGGVPAWVLSLTLDFMGKKKK
jgi:hypothetical protein